MPRRLILCELNEVPWRVVDDFVDRHPGSALASVLPRSSSFTTLAADLGDLSPWTTWPTLHRGVNADRHMIAAFGQDLAEADERFPPLWRILHGAGVPVGVCGSLHSFPPPADLGSYRFYLPDAFAAAPTAHPSALMDFQAFNLAMVSASSRNVDTAIPRAAAARLLLHGRQLGVRPATAAKVALHLASERQRPWLRTRRRALQSMLTFDIYAKLLEATRPAFSTYFTNHVAAAMHRYWAAAYPSDYDRIELPQEWIDTYRGEVDWAVGRADEMVGRLAAFVDSNPEYQLWITTSMGQAPTFAQPLETQLYLEDVATFMAAVATVPESRWSRLPAMLPQCNVRVDAAFAGAFEVGLKELTVDRAPLRFRRAEDGFFSMDWGQANLHDAGDALRLRGEVWAPESLGLRSVEIEDRSDTTAYHVPEGILAVYDPRQRTEGPFGRNEVSVLEIAPAILAMFGVPAPAYMTAPSVLGMAMAA